MLPFLRLRHGLPPSSCSATSQACEKSKSIKRDHHNTNSSCASPMLWCTGLGSNSSTGSPKRNTNGDATYTYRCRPFLTTIQDYFAGPPPSSFLLLVWTQDSWDTPRLIVPVLHSLPSPRRRQSSAAKCRPCRREFFVISRAAFAILTSRPHLSLEISTI